MKKIFFLFWFLGFPSNQCYENASLRILYYATFTSAVIIYTSFSAKIISILSVKEFELPFDNLESFYRTDYSLIMNKNGQLIESFSVNIFLLKVIFVLIQKLIFTKNQQQ